MVVFDVLELVCKVECLYYSTNTQIKAVFADGSLPTAIIASVGGAKIDYDKGAERLVYFLTSTNKLYSVKRDGSDLTDIADIPSLEDLSVDYIARRVYHYEGGFKEISYSDEATMMTMDNFYNLGTGIRAIDTVPGTK